MLAAGLALLGVPGVLMALGSVAVGVIAGLTSFATAFLVAGAIAVATLPLGVRRAGAVEETHAAP